MSDAQPTWIGRTLGGRYIIDSLLGHGGMSSVYKAKDPNLRRTVAVKMIHPHLSDNEEFVLRFEQEATAVARLRHPNIMQVHDFNHDGGVYYIVFEHIPGQPLDQKLKDLQEANLKMPLIDTLEIMGTLCNAIGYAHDQGMIHRDLKPSNVMLNLLNQPILLDFGIAKIVGGSGVRTATGATVGTASYMPPEQVTGAPVDHRADIYALGVMLYEMAAGRPPYEGESTITIMMKHVQEPLPDIQLYNSNLPTQFIAILERALAKDPQERFNSASEMSVALAEVHQQLVAAQGTQIGTAVLPTTPIPTPPPQPVTVETGSSPTMTAVSPPTPAPATTTPAPAKKKRSMLPIAIMGGLILIVAGYFIFSGILSSAPTPTSVGMVNIPSGSYSVGSNNGGAQYAIPQTVELTEYWIDRYEVSNADYANYLADNDADRPASWDGNAFFPSGEGQLPVQGITWEAADDYCSTLGKRLPTESEWEVAARGQNALLYPWGDEETAVSLPADLYAVGSMAANRTPFGVLDMASNVWEWVADPYTEVSDDNQIARGGAYNFQKDMAYRLEGNPSVPSMYNTAGIRCAASVVEVVTDDAILVEDDFTNEASGWPILEEASALSGYHPPDFYHVQSGAVDSLAAAYFPGNYANITMEADVFIDSTDSEEGLFRYGLIVRRKGSNFYAFTISPRTNEWAVLKATDAGLETVESGQSETMSGFAVESSDTLRIDASGSDLAFSINGRIVSTLSDSDYPDGEIGFYVETFDESRAHIHYDLIRVEQVANAQ